MNPIGMKHDETSHWTFHKNVSTYRVLNNQQLYERSL